MFERFEVFAELSRPFVEACCQFAKRHGVQDRVVLDHICFKCASSADFESMRSLLERRPPSAYLYQTYLAGRRVAYIGLLAGLPTSLGGALKCVELADKKPGATEQSGFHHVEIYPVGISRHALVVLLQQAGVNITLKERPHHTTYDIALPDGFLIRITDVPLIRKIAERELQSVTKETMTQLHACS